MGKVEKIEHEIETLSQQELEELRGWFFEFDAKAWDQQIEKDVLSGKLDAAADDALKAFNSGKASEL